MVQRQNGPDDPAEDKDDDSATKDELDAIADELHRGEDKHNVQGASW